STACWTNISEAKTTTHGRCGRFSTWKSGTAGTARPETRPEGAPVAQARLEAEPPALHDAGGGGPSRAARAAGAPREGGLAGHRRRAGAGSVRLFKPLRFP